MTAPEPARRPPSRSRGGDPAPGADLDRRSGGEPHPLAALQEAFGNLGVARRLADPAVQARLEIGAPNDDYEREADRVAASIMRRPEPTSTSAPAEPHVRRRAEDDDRKKPTPPPQRATGAAAKTPPAPPPKAPAPEAKKPAEPPRTAEAPASKTTPPSAKKPEPKKKEPPKEPHQPAGGPERKREEDTVARKPAGGAVPSLSPAAARTIQSQQGAGRPLSTADRSFFEPRFGHDLGAVRIHDDAAARGAAHDINAQAFTYGQDIYFGAGRYQPGTEGGRELLAHELAHTVQQRPGARLERRVQRLPATQGTSTSAAPAQTTQGGQAAPAPGQTPLATRTGDTVEFADTEALPVPKWRATGPNAARYQGRLVRSKAYTEERRRSANQRGVWLGDAAGIKAGVRSKVDSLVDKNHPQTDPGRAGRYVLKTNTSPGVNYLVGTVDELAAALAIPNWDRVGRTRPHGFDVDHIRELQVANFPTDSTDQVLGIGNLELLEAGVNRSSGTLIRNAIEGKMTSYIASLPQAEREQYASWKSAFNVAFPRGTDRTRVRGHAAGIADSATQNDHWTSEEIRTGAHMPGRRVVPASWSELGRPGAIAIFAREVGGYRRELRSNAPKPSEGFLRPFNLVDFQLHDRSDELGLPQVADLTLELGPGKGLVGPPERHTIQVPRMRGAQFAGYISRQSALALFRAQRLSVPGLSSVEIDDVDIDAGGFTAAGRVIADVPLLRGTEIELTLAGDTIAVSKTFVASDFHLPEPFHLDQAALTVTASTRDLSLDGRIDASIARLGTGFLEARGSIRDGLSMAGGFTATNDLFRSSIRLAYQHGELSGQGTLDIDAGKVPGVRHGHLEASYGAGRWTGTGTADFTIPGVRSGTVEFSYDPTHGLTIGGTLAVGAIPGIREGTISATISERPDGSGYKLAAHGSATAAIPGFEAQLAIDYDDGAFLAQVTLPVHRGLIEGEITLGATNRPVDENNRPIPNAPPLPEVSIFGSGTATMQITSWLRGTATVKLLPNGELEVDGTLSVPGVNLWPEVAPEPTTLIHPPDLEFPIFGPVVLTFGGHLDLKYGLSAGVLSGSLSVHYNPAHEDQTHLHGAIHLHASAYAGLELDIDVGIALDALVGSIGGSIELGAEVRADASIDPDIQIDWTPSTGFVIDPVFEAAVTPRLLFHIRARVTASLAFWSKTWTKSLADYAFGSGLALTVRLPAHYDETHGFSVDWNRLEFHHPDIDPLQTAKDFIEELV